MLTQVLSGFGGVGKSELAAAYARSLAAVVDVLVWVSNVELCEHLTSLAALPVETPPLQVETFNAVASARAALASLASSARQLPNPSYLRRPTLRRGGAEHLRARRHLRSAPGGPRRG